MGDVFENSVWAIAVIVAFSVAVPIADAVAVCGALITAFTFTLADANIFAFADTNAEAVQRPRRCLRIGADATSLVGAQPARVRDH